MRQFHCTCGNLLYFDSISCLRCGLAVGYDPVADLMRPLAPGWRLCDNGSRHGVCNWLLPESSGDLYCASCRLNRIIPDLRQPNNLAHWAVVEAAKRRLIRTLLCLGMPLPNLAENATEGLAFEIVSTTLDPTLTTGYLRGVITLSMEEADDTWRQINRQQLGEASRTLLGHCRHESGHHVWGRVFGRLDWNDPLRQAFVEVFGEPSLDYAAALQRHYGQGPPPDWQERHISAYASAHPWEDWAETWAHYLQILDSFETCQCLGIRGGGLDLPLVILPVESCTLPASLKAAQSEDPAFHAWLQRWICLATMLNEVTRSFGSPFLYPYIISPAVARKLRLAHHVAHLWRPFEFPARGGASA